MWAQCIVGSSKFVFVVVVVVLLPQLTEVPGQGSKLHHRSDNEGSLTCCTTRELLESIFFFLSFFFFPFFWPHLQHMEIPGPGIKSEPQLQPMPQLQQCPILNLLSYRGNTPSKGFLNKSI